MSEVLRATLTCGIDPNDSLVARLAGHMVEFDLENENGGFGEFPMVDSPEKLEEFATQLLVLAENLRELQR